MNFSKLIHRFLINRIPAYSATMDQPPDPNKSKNLYAYADGCQLIQNNNSTLTPNLITSLVRTPDLGLMHAPVIDIDVPCDLLPSSQPNHYHLYINKTMTWDSFAELLKVMTKVGLVEEGYCKATLERGYSCVRPPGTLKPGVDHPMLGILKQLAIAKKHIFTLEAANKALSFKYFFLARKIEQFMSKEQIDAYLKESFDKAHLQEVVSTPDLGVIS